MAAPNFTHMDQDLQIAISRQFCSVEQWKEAFQNAALSVFGSGYAWLVWDKGKLKITTSANQDCPLTKGQKPILCIDVWEHAYYLKYVNVRADYIKGWFHVINWKRAGQLFKEASLPYGNRQPLFTLGLSFIPE